MAILDKTGGKFWSETNFDILDNVIESGSNENGNWVKFADGTQICSGTIEVDLSVWRFTAGYKQYPQPFVGGVAISYARHSPPVDYQAQMKALGSLVPNNNQTAVMFGVGEPTTQQNIFTLTYTAIGRWK